MRGWKTSSLLKYSLIKPAVTWSRDGWILLTFQSCSVSEMFTSWKGKTTFMHLLSFQTKSKGTLDFWGLWPQTSKFYFTVYSKVEWNKLSISAPLLKFFLPPVTFPSLHSCVICPGFLLVWFCLLSTFAFTCLSLVLPQLKHLSSPS